MLEYHLDIWYQPHTISYLLKGTQIIVLDNEHGASKTQHNSCHRVDLLIAKHRVTTFNVSSATKQ